MIGEHTDWAAGYRNQNRAIPPGFTLVATTREGLHARVGTRADGRLVFKAATCSSSHAPPLPPASSKDSGDDGVVGDEETTAASTASTRACGAAGAAPVLDVAMTEEVTNASMSRYEIYPPSQRRLSLLGRCGFGGAKGGGGG